MRVVVVVVEDDKLVDVPAADDNVEVDATGCSPSKFPFSIVLMVVLLLLLNSDTTGSFDI